jgi:hypothetical protein
MLAFTKNRIIHVVLYTATTATFSICMSSWRSISLVGIGSFLTQERGWSRWVVARGTRWFVAALNWTWIKMCFHHGHCGTRNVKPVTCFISGDPSVWAVENSSRLRPPVYCDLPYWNIKKLNWKINSLAWVRERTIPTERPPLVCEVSANFCG